MTFSIGLCALCHEPFACHKKFMSLNEFRQMVEESYQ